VKGKSRGVNEKGTKERGRREEKKREEREGEGKGGILCSCEFSQAKPCLLPYSERG